MKKIKDKTLWCIGSDRLLNQKERYGVDYYDGFMYSDCGDIILGVLNKNRAQFSPMFLEKSKPMITCVPYIIGKPVEHCPLL